MRVRFAGSGDAFGSGGRWQTCIHLSAEGQVLLVDCGATSLVALKAQGLDPNAVGAVAVTHLHGDQFRRAAVPDPGRPVLPPVRAAAGGRAAGHRTGALRCR